MRIVVGAVVMVMAGCGGADGEPSAIDARELVAVDAGQDAPAEAGPAWCTPLNDVQSRCRVDPMLACEAHNGTQPTSAYACGAWASPPGCVGFTPDNCTAMVFCCP